MANDSPPHTLSPTRRLLAMLSLIVAGEAVFVPIYHLNRYFKSSFAAVFEIDESQIGDLFVWYGAVAMVCYFLGGPIADRFSPRKLLVLSLLTTAAGGVFMATIPTLATLKWLYAGWGVTSILLFWAPLMRATREWGGEASQGRAFGLLDGGRGLLSAAIASAAAWIFASNVNDGVNQADAVEKLLWFYSGCAAFAALMVLAFLPTSPKAADHSPENAPTNDAASPSRMDAAWRVISVLRLPTVWLQAMIVLAAYTAFRGFDNYGKYAEEAFGVTDKTSASLTAALSYIRAGAALAAGWVADRWLGVSNTIGLGFVTLLVCFGLLLAIPTTESYYAIAVANMAVSAVAFFGLRGIYFALFEESQVPRALTGAAIGVISFIGFTPDIFFPKLYGWLVTTARERGDVLVGYERLWMLLAGFSLVGLIASQRLGWVNRLAASAVESDVSPAEGQP